MVMAAGVGSRLNPLTNNIPKPLVPVLNRPVMDILLEKLSDYGIESVIANTHYLAEQIQHRYIKNSPINIKFDYIHETELSGTAGGVKKCEFFFAEDENFLVVSADGFHDADLDKIIRSHEESGCIATMAISEVDHAEVCHYGVVVPTKDYTVSEFQEKPKIEEAKSNYINTGIYVFNKRIFEFIPQNQKYDFAKDVFPKLLEANEKINIYRIQAYWSDIGTIEQYIQSNIDALNRKVIIKNPNIMRKFESVYTCDSSTVLDESVTLSGHVVIGKNCKIGKNVSLENVIIWDNVTIADNINLQNIVCGSNSIINHSIKAFDKWEIVAPNTNLQKIELV